MAPRPGAAGEGYDVRVDVLNVTNRDVTLHAGWWYEGDKGGLKDYIEAATSIEAYPPIAPWVGQVWGGDRKSPQPTNTLKPGDGLSVGWHADGRQLKRKLTDPNSVQNPKFPFPGLYSVHATLKINIGDRLILLGSNEQLVAVGGSRCLPKFSYGQLWGVEAATETATLSLGSLHGIEPGDEFQTMTAKRGFWKLTITWVAPEYSQGRLEPLSRLGPNAMNPNPPFPERHLNVTLIPRK